MKTETIKKDGSETTHEIDITTEKETEIEYKFKGESDTRWWKFATLLILLLFAIVFMLIMKG
jgi:hypothetical protein